MVRAIFYCFLCLCTIGCSQRTIPLLNKKDLSGWKINGTEKWYVQDGELICESGPNKKYGYLSTEKSYKNFILSLEFKQESNGNSGVFIRSGIKGIKISGWQVEIAPPGLFTGGIYESYGREWLIQPKAEDETLKFGEWNKMTIEARNDEITTHLNGKKMVYLQDEKIGKGNGVIALQIHEGGGTKIRFRNIRIRELK